MQKYITSIIDLSVPYNISLHDALQHGIYHTKIAYSSCSSDSMDIFFDISRQVKVDDMLDVGNVETSSCNLTYARKQ